MNPSPHSWRMSRIPSKGNKTTEELFATLLRAEHIFGWRRHVDLAGRPDFALRKARIAIFIDGCFWHGCRKCNKNPKSNNAFWAQKFAYNRKRASIVNRELRRDGWLVLRIWEHQLRFPDRAIARVRSLLALRAACSERK
jgi:DNA mismatch endonuclease (patch repair protein)